LREKFPKLRDTKLKYSIFFGPQICEINYDDLTEHLLTETAISAWLTFNTVFLNFLGNVKAENYKELVEDLLNAYQTMGCNVTEVSFFTFPLGLLPSKLGSNERRTWGKVPLGYFHHGENVCRKVVIEHVSRLLLEPYCRGVYCQLQMNELQKEVSNMRKIKHLVTHISCVTA